MPARRKLHEQMMGEILAGIVAGEYPERSRLPKETDLAARHDVSRYVARECIQALRDRGVLTVKHGVGATIAPREDWHLFDEVLLEAMLSGPDSDHVAAEIAECRRAVWPEVAAVAARRRRRADLAALQAALGDRDAFHAALLDAARNRFLRHTVAALDRAAPLPAAGRPARLEAVHEAIEAQDAGAAREAMLAHVEREARSRRPRG